MADAIPADILTKYEALYGLEARVRVENLAARFSEASEELTDWNLRLISEARGIAIPFSHAGHHSRSACEWLLNLSKRLAHDAIILESRGRDGARVLAVIDAADFGLVGVTIDGELLAIDGHTALHPAGWPPRGIRGLVSELASWQAIRVTDGAADGGEAAFKQTGSPSPVAQMTTAIEPTGQPVAENTGDEDQFARYSDPLTPLGKRILKSLWSRQFAVQFESLRVEAWEGSEVSASGIERRLQAIEKRWMEAGLDDIDLEISPATTSVKLVKPLTKTGDKKGDN